MVQAAAIMAAAASTALPPLWNIIEPAVAASGLPVMAIQCAPWSGGFWVRWAVAGRAAARTRRRARADRLFMSAQFTAR
jgi:hypothetical protein